MIDVKQAEHFKLKDNRYSNNLLFNPPKHTQEEISIIIDTLKKRDIKKVAELGSGNGRLTIPLLKNEIYVTAIDICKESLGELTNTIRQMDIKMDLLSTSTTIPIDTYEAFVGCDILHHVDIDTYLKKMKKRVTKHKGLLLFSEPNIVNISWLIFITLFLDWTVEKGIFQCNYFTLLQKLKKNHYTNIQILGFGLLPPPLLNMFPLLQKMNYWFGSLPIVKFFAYRFIIKAEMN